MRGLLWPGIAPTMVAVAVASFAAGRAHLVETEHYNVRTDVDERFTRLVGEHMEAIYGEYAVRLKGYELKVHGKFQVRVFARREDYDAAVPAPLAGSAGAFVSADRLLAACKEGRTDEQVFRTLYHEGFHQFLYCCVSQDCPLWVNEGLAEYFSEATWNGRSFSTGQVPAGRLFVITRAVNANEHIPLEALFRMESREWLRNMKGLRTAASLQYCQAWSVVHFLIHAEDGRRGTLLLDYLRRVSEGMDHERAFERSFSSYIAAFERAWKSYVLRLRPGPDQVCRGNLEILAFIAMKIYGTPERFTSLQHLHERLTDRRLEWYVVTSYGERVASSDSQRTASLFMCPYDRKRRGASYILLRNAQTGLPELYCNHHRGIVVRAYYVRRPDGECEVEVEQVVRKTLEPALVRKLEAESRR